MTSAAAIWSERVRTYGRRCVVNLAIPEEELEAETERQRSILFPLLHRELAQPPVRALDFGCGYGRFTTAIKRETRAATMVGYDPCPELVQLARADYGTVAGFLTGSPGRFFGTVAPFGLIWVLLVLGGVADAQLDALAESLAGALVPGGLLFFAEDTGAGDAANAFWHFRSAAAYEELFHSKGVDVRLVGSYPDAVDGHDVGVFAGRRAVSP